MTEVVVLDNVIPVELQDRILDMVQDHRFNWHFAPSNIYEGDEVRGQTFLDNRTIDSFQFYHLFVHTEINYNEPFYEHFRPLVNGIQKAFNLQNTNVLRVKANMLTNNRRFYPLAYNPAHVDGEYDHWVVVYYVNDSDGDTVIFNQTYGSQYEELTEMARVSPKKGRAVCFPGKYFHASSNPTTLDWRCVFNINLSTSGPIIL